MASPVDNDKEYVEQISSLIAKLSQQPEKEVVASEIEVLQSIYGVDAVRVWHPPKDNNHDNHDTRGTTGAYDAGVIRYEALLSLPSPHEGISIRVLVTLPSTYPASSPPQLQLLSRYIGAFGADSSLFGSILRTFISINGIEWAPDSVCVFDGLQNVVEKCGKWYEERLSAEKAGELMREDERGSGTAGGPSAENSRGNLIQSVATKEEPSAQAPALPEGLEMFIAEPIVDRKSSFIGRACRISHPSEVPIVLSYLTSDRRIARAAHPIINAWRCQVGTVLYQDNDDDGENAAGGRLAHLLQILELNNVLVVVTRYFGGIHLGPDRFKHINQAARNALELGGFLDSVEPRKQTGRSKRH